MRVLFRVEANETLGLGHLSRCRSLALELVQRFPCCPVFAITQTQTGQSFLRGLRASIIQPGQLLGGDEFDVVITDIPGLCLNEQKRLSGVASLHVGIDDDNAGPFAYDILIRPNLLDLPLPMAPQKKAFDYWKGKEYIILHPDFAIWRPSSVGRKKVENILVCFGGSDPAGLTLSIVPVLRQLVQDIQIRIVVGAAFKNIEGIKSAVANKPNMTLSVNCMNMAEMLSLSDIALINGGTLLYEACALGVPAIVVCHNELQQQEAEVLARMGAIINLGTYSQVTNQNINYEIRKLIDNTTQRQRMFEAAKRSITSDGTGRIVSNIIARIRCS